jgi:DNA-binding transcriptional MocR family regulator
MLLVTLDRDAPEPLFRQLIARVVTLVDSGALHPGDRLPPTRSLAEDLGVHRSTVVRAYRELRALGYLDSRAGGYSTVRRRARLPATRAGLGAPTTDALDFEALLTPRARGALRDLPRDVGSHGDPPALIDLSRLVADPRLAPVDELRHHLQRCLGKDRDGVLDYGSGLGHPPLRSYLATRMRAHGIAVGPEQVLVTQGAQQGLDLVQRLLVQPGDRVVLEAPSYAKAHALLRLHGAVPVEVPMGPEGMDLDVLEGALEGARPKLVYTVPTFHNPTGITSSQAHRERLLALCEARGVPIVEDGFEEELKYLGAAALPIKSMDRLGQVLYLGTFSKVIFPGLRLGWLAVPPSAAAPLASLHRASCLSGVTLVQAAMARFCVSGGFEAHLRRVHRVYRHRMSALVRGLEAHLPSGVAWHRPRGGFATLLRVEGCSLDEPELCARLLAAGVRVEPGASFFAAPPAVPHLRVSTAVEDGARIAEGCRILGEVLRSYASSTPSSS